jgi:hypothetical protein
MKWTPHKSDEDRIASQLMNESENHIYGKLVTLVSMTYLFSGPYLLYEA